MKIETSKATVYHGGGRRYLTLSAAKYAEARRIVKETVCDCEKGDPDSFNGRGYPGNVCTYHKLFDVAQRELVKWTMVNWPFDPEIITDRAEELLSQQTKDSKLDPAFND